MCCSTYFHTLWRYFLYAFGAHRGLGGMNIYFSSCSVVWVLSPSISVCSFAASTPRVYTILSVALWVHCLVAQFATCVPQHSMVFSDLVLVLCALLGACCCACIPFGVVLNIQLFLDVASWGIFWVGLWGPTSKDDC